MCGALNIGRAVQLLFGCFLTILTATEFTALIQARDESAQRHLAKFYLYNDRELARSATKRLTGQDRANAIEVSGIYLELLERDPSSPARWSDLGDSLNRAGQRWEAERCFERALELGRNVPQILLDVGDFYVTSGEPRRALPYFGRFLSLVSEYDAAVFNYFDNMKLSAHDLGAGGALPTSRAANSYLRHLLSVEDTSAAKNVWNWMTLHGYVDDRAAGNAYVDFLLTHRLAHDALTTWAHYAGDRSIGYLTSTFIYNGDFETEPSGSRLDWRIDAIEHVKVTRDSTIAHSGSSSLQLHFDGKENTDFHHVTQELVLDPGAYELEAYVRTRDLSTDEGVALRLSSSEPGFALDINTESVIGATDWKRVSKSFSIAGATRMLTLQVLRRPSLRFDNQISGSAWIDSVLITRNAH